MPWGAKRTTMARMLLVPGLPFELDLRYNGADPHLCRKIRTGTYCH